MHLGIPRGEMDWSEEPEDKFGYEEYRRATERRKTKVQPKKLTEEKPAAETPAEEKSDADSEVKEVKTTPEEKE